jgi:putative transposase
MDKSGR